jgi:Cu(I)/Ag(I) efflux system periplasmic protein CusF
MNTLKKSSMNAALATLVAVMGLAAAPAWAQTAAAPASAAAPVNSQAMSEGVVRKIDLAQHKITLKHGEIKNLDMPGMTMVFVVSDPALLQGVKPGDAVRFKADNVDGKLTVVALTPAH